MATKRYSEADMGSMAGYDPNLGLGKKGYAKATKAPSSMNGGKQKGDKGPSKPMLSAIKFGGGGANISNAASTTARYTKK